MVWPDGAGAAVGTAVHPTHRRILGLAPTSAGAHERRQPRCCTPGAGGRFGGAGAVQAAQATIEFLANQAAAFAVVEASITTSRQRVVTLAR